MTEYAPDGLFGLLVPQANTTAEIEAQILCPPGRAMLTARMTSSRGTMEDRLSEYLSRIDDTVACFANAPIRAVGFACTGASYLVDPDIERRILTEVAQRRGLAVITAARAVTEALRALGARRIGLVSPYGDGLHAAGLRYWAARGFDIGPVERLTGHQTAFHPIYALSSDDALAGLAAIGCRDVDAIVILGTGLATLGALLDRPATAVPVLTPNLALVWSMLAADAGAAPNRASLEPWLNGTGWAERLRARSAP